MSPKSNSKSDLKFGQINFNHGLTDELQRKGLQKMEFHISFFNSRIVSKEMCFILVEGVTPIFPLLFYSEAEMIHLYVEPAREMQYNLYELNAANHAETSIAVLTVYWIARCLLSK